MTFAILTLLLSAEPVRVEPTTLTFGPAEAKIELVAPGAVALQVRCVNCIDGAGAVSGAEPAGPGRFLTRFTFPKERIPRVAMLAVEARTASGERSHAWVALPLLARANLKIETKPRASVNVSIGSRLFGPVFADSKGKLTLPVIIPPGYPSATVVASDRAGNVTTSALDLAARPFPCAAAVLPGAEVAADESVPIEVFAIETDGAPLADARRLRLGATLGVTQPALARAAGVFVVGYRAPRSIVGGPDTLSVAVDGSPVTLLRVPLRPAARARIAVTLSSDEFTAGSGKRVAVAAVVTDAFGNLVGGQGPAISSDFGAVEPTAEGAQLAVPNSFGGRTQVRIRAAGSGVDAEAALRLHAGPPATAGLTMPARVAAGEPATGVIWVKDAWGNAVDATTVGVVTPEGRLATVTAAQGQDYAVGYESAKGDPVGPLDLEVRAGERTLARTEITVLPYQRPWAVVAGAFIAGSWNLKQARAVSPRLSLALRLGRLPFEVGAEAAFSWYPRLYGAQTIDGVNAVDVDMTAWSAMIAVRYSLTLTARWSLQLSAAGGAQFVQSTLTAPGIAPSNQFRWGPVGRGGTGLAVAALGGRLLIQLEFGVAPLGGGNVRGNSEGLGVALGYLASF